MISECFTALCFANAFGGSRSDKWDVIFNYKVDQVFSEAKRRNLQLAGLKAAVGEGTIESRAWAKPYLQS